jgi:hypothetical protein
MKGQSQADATVVYTLLCCPLAVETSACCPDVKLAGTNKHMHVVVDVADGPTPLPWIAACSTQGLTEEGALEAGHKDLDIHTTSFKPMRNQLSGSPLRTMMKVWVTLTLPVL